MVDVVWHPTRQEADDFYDKMKIEKGCAREIAKNEYNEKEFLDNVEP